MKYFYLALYIVVCAFLFGALDWAVVNWKYHHRDERAWLDNHEALYVQVVGSTEMILSPVSYAARLHFFYLLYNTAPRDEWDDLNHWGYDGNPFLWNGIGQSVGRFSGLPWVRISLLDWYLQWLPLYVIWFVALVALKII